MKRIALHVKPKRTALYVGRFQPFHLGHASVIKHLLKRYRKVIIAVGSIDKEGKDNPFSFGQRKAMINAVFGRYRKRYRIIGIKDFKSDKRWIKEAERKARFDVVVTANLWTKRCFRGYEVVKPRAIKPRLYNATRIRKLIMERKKWESRVPKEIVPIIRERSAEHIRDFLDDIRG